MFAFLGEVVELIPDGLGKGCVGRDLPAGQGRLVQRVGPGGVGHQPENPFLGTQVKLLKEVSETGVQIVDRRGVANVIEHGQNLQLIDALGLMHLFRREWPKRVVALGQAQLIIGGRQFVRLYQQGLPAGIGPCQLRPQELALRAHVIVSEQDGFPVGQIAG